VNGNPAENISDIRKVEMVMKDGVVYRASSIQQVLGIK